MDGLGLGDNTKAAVIRLGLMEMIKFVDVFYPGSKLSTFFESCGVADLITTCYGGRNRRVSEAFVKTGKTIKQLEDELLNGQKLQGPFTAEEVNFMLKNRKMEERLVITARPIHNNLLQYIFFQIPTIHSHSPNLQRRVKTTRIVRLYSESPRAYVSSIQVKFVCCIASLHEICFVSFYHKIVYIYIFFILQFVSTYLLHVAFYINQEKIFFSTFKNK